MPNNLVSTNWLHESLRAPDIAVIDGSWYLPAQNRDGKAEYLARHIPGAVHFDIEEISDHSSSLPHMMPQPEQFARQMSELGISESMRIIVYDGAGLFSAPRVWWMLRVFGARDVRILDGGSAEMAERRPARRCRARQTPAGQVRGALRREGRCRHAPRARGPGDGCGASRRRALGGTLHGRRARDSPRYSKRTHARRPERPLLGFPRSRPPQIAGGALPRCSSTPASRATGR